MAKKVEIAFTSPGASRVFRDFDKLTKKEQEIILQGSKVGATLEAAGRKASNAGRKGASAFDKLKSKIRFNIDAVNILTKGFQIAQQEFARLERIQSTARTRQQTVDAAIGGFIANNAQAVQRDPALLRTVRRFAIQEGTVLGEGGIAEVIQGLTELRSKAGEGFTLEQQLGAIRQAITAKIIDPAGVNLGDIATANLRTQQALGVNERKAQNILTAFGPTAGGDINAFVAEFGQLSGAIQGLAELEKRRFGAQKTTFVDALALEGFLSQQLGIDAERTTTIVTNLLGKLDLAQQGKQPFQFESQNALDRLVELSKAFVSGQVEREDVRKLLTSAGLKGAQGPGVLGLVAGREAKLRRDRESIASGLSADFSIQERSLGLLSASRRDDIQFGLQKGFIDAFKQTQLDESKRSRAVSFDKQLAEEFDLGTIDRLRGFVDRVNTQVGLGGPERLRRRSLIRLANTVGESDEERAKIFRLMLEQLESIDRRLKNARITDTGGQ